MWGLYHRASPCIAVHCHALLCITMHRQTSPPSGSSSLLRNCLESEDRKIKKFKLFICLILNSYILQCNPSISCLYLIDFYDRHCGIWSWLHTNTHTLGHHSPQKPLEHKIVSKLWSAWNVPLLPVGGIFRKKQYPILKLLDVVYGVYNVIWSKYRKMI